MTMSTERLTVRPFRESDGEALYAYLSDPEVVRHEPYKPFDRASALAEAKRRATDERFLAVCLADGTLIGNLYFEKGGFDTWEIGYVFSRAHWGHGYASEAVRALIGHLFGARNAHRVVAHCDPRNPHSWRLLERVGMRREAEHRQNVYFFTDEAGQPLWKDSYAYAMLREEWETPMKLRLLDLAQPDEAELWWTLFDAYIREAADNPYFASPKYRETIQRVNTRKQNPMRLAVPMVGDRPAGICSYVIYHDENEKGQIAEFGVIPALRRRGLGTRLYQAVEREILREGGAYIDLTPGDAAAECFWGKQGYAKTDVIGENGLLTWTKRLDG